MLPPCPPPEVDVEAWDRTVAEIRRRAPARLALVHFGVFDDVESHLARFSERLHAWSGRIESGMDAPAFLAAARRDVEEAGDDAAYYDRAAPFWHCYLGLERYWRKRREAAPA